MNKVQSEPGVLIKYDTVTVLQKLASLTSDRLARLVYFTIQKLRNLLE